MSDTYLRRCLELFEDTMESRHGWKPDYPGLEAEMLEVRTGRRELCARDLDTIQQRRFWDFRQFWRFPVASDLMLETDFAEMSRLIVKLPSDEEQTLQRLHAAFKFIENVSVLLRFIQPRHYGIISPPVEKLLAVRRGRTEVTTYLNYLRDLREIARHHDLPRAADADMALWVIQERVLSSWSEPDLRRAFRDDAWLARRIAANMLADLADVAGMRGHLELARALAVLHPLLAGTLAGAEMERRLRAAARPHDRSQPLTSLVESAEARLVERGEKGAADRLRRALKLRDAFLAPGEGPGLDEALELIEVVEGLPEGSSG